MDRGFVTDWKLRSQGSPFNPGGQKEDLFLEYCRLVEEGAIEPTRTCSLDVVDNFYVNGEFHYRRDHTEKEWKRLRRSAIVALSDILITSF